MRSLSESWLFRHRLETLIVTLILFFSVLGMFLASFISVPAGHVAIITSAPNGNNIGRMYDEGWHFDLGFMFCDVEIIRYNTQSMEFTIVGTEDVLSVHGPINVRSADNLEVHLDMTIIYSLPKEKVSEIRLEYGDYKQTILDQYARSVPRDMASEFNALDMAGPNRIQLEERIRTELRTQLGQYNIVVEDVRLREIQLPAEVNAAVERKKVAEQDWIAANYTASRMIVIAEGQATALVINATAQAQAVLISANATAEAIDYVMTSLLAADPNATIEDYLTLMYIFALTDPDGNVSYIVFQGDSETPIILNPEA